MPASHDDLGRQGLVRARMLGLNVHMKSSAPESAATIGDVAVRFGLPQHVLRHWESVGLLTPARDSSGHRRHGPAELARIAMILMGKEAGFGLGELQVLLSGPDPMRHADRLRRHVAVLDRRIAEATAAKELIEHALHSLDPRVRRLRTGRAARHMVTRPGHLATGAGAGSR